MEIMKDRLKELIKKVNSDEFFNNRGLANEVPFYIFDYNPKYELEIRDFVKNSLLINLENNELEIWLDMRIPVKIKNEQIIETIKKNTEDFGYEFVLHSNTQPLYVPKDSFLVSTLMDIYKDLTGDKDAEPVAIGGGTYAKYANNTVAFGALLPEQEDRMHQRDEYLEISKIDKLLQIYVEAIYKLAK